MNKTTIKIGSYLCALLMMGAIAVASNIANMIAAFPEVAPTTIVAYLISVPCLVVIPVTLITGKLMETQSKKNLMIVGILFWLIGGVLPYFLKNLTMIMLARGIFGIGIGMVQTLTASLVIENFEDEDERNKTMGTMTAFQMLGSIIFALVAGKLGKLGWHVPFLVHLIALISLVGAIFFLPNVKPSVIGKGGEKVKFTPTPMMWTWAIGFFLFMMGAQTYANSVSSLLAEMNLGGSAEAGNSLAIFAFGGLIMGVSFGYFAKIFGKMTLSLGCLLMIVAFAIITFIPSLFLAYFGSFIAGAAISICMPCIFNGIAASVDRASAGMAISIATCLQNVGMALSPYVVTTVGEIISDSTNARYTLNQGALIAAVAILSTVALAFAFINSRPRV